jgi:hypothetical protein
MGHNSTGITTVNAAQRIELSYLIKWGYFSRFGNQQLTWTDGSTIGVEIVHRSNETYLQLNYTISNNKTAEKTEMNYKVYIEFVPSNLGKGRVMYFICPISGKRCRILYRAYGSLHFKAREAYTHRLYYNAQRNSQKFKLFNQYNTAYFKLEVIRRNKRREQKTFKGKPTKYTLKYNDLCEKIEKLNYLTERFVNIFL